MYYKRRKSQINNLIFHLKTTDKEPQTKSKARRWKEMIKIINKAEINET